MYDTHEYNEDGLDSRVTTKRGPRVRGHVLHCLTNHRHRFLWKHLRVHVALPDLGIPEKNLERIPSTERDHARAFAELARDAIRERRGTRRQRVWPREEPGVLRKGTMRRRRDAEETRGQEQRNSGY